MEFRRVELQAPHALVPELERFYADWNVPLVFTPAGGEPFYHFAFLVPGDRFDAARAWAEERVELLPGGDVDGVVFDFANWNALACYFHDPAGNIVELIAHRDVEPNGKTGPFSGAELLGVSELGLVGDPLELAAALERVGLELWDGTLEEPGRLAFVGEPARTLILSPEGRGWLPTGRPAEPHPVSALLTGPPVGEVTAAGHRIHRV